MHVRDAVRLSCHKLGEYKSVGRVARQCEAFLTFSIMMFSFICAFGVMCILNEPLEFPVCRETFRSIKRIKKNEIGSMSFDVFQNISRIASHI